jgi:hypothetical protein
MYKLIKQARDVTMWDACIQKKLGSFSVSTSFSEVHPNHDIRYKLVYQTKIYGAA